MKKKVFVTIREYFYWIYANMGMAHFALKNNHYKYSTYDYMIRAKLYKGLKTGRMSISSIYEDEKHKLSNIECVYCGKSEELSLDHLISRFNGGDDSGNNLVYACKRCNSSKNKKDLLVWHNDKNSFPPILVLRRYLKLAYQYYECNDILNEEYECVSNYIDFFRLDLIPYEFPQPNLLRL